MTEEAATETALLYRDRTWSEVENPIQPREGEIDWTEMIQRHGWLLSQTIGDAEGISIDLYQRHPGTEACRYMALVEYNTSGICKTIVIERFQDLIDFLAHVSTTMLAVLLPGDFVHVLDELLDKTPYRVDKKREHRWRSVAQPSDNAVKLQETKP